MESVKRPSEYQGPLRPCPSNPRYFADERGNAVYLTGSHTWANLQEMKCEGDEDFDYDAFLDMLASHNHNFMRMWQWMHPEMAPWTLEKMIFEPLPFARTGPGKARDGKPKFDLDTWNEDYFQRLRSRIMQAGERGIYVSIMFFEGFCIKWAIPESDPWLSHPFNSDNNINKVHGDADGDGKADIFSLELPKIVEYQKKLIRKVVDTVNDLDHVMYEILNEIPNDARGMEWHYHMIDYAHEYERTKPKQHPVGMTAEGGGQNNALLFASPADWISPGRGSNEEYKFDPPAGDGSKVVISDTDHLWGHGGTYRWVWKSFLRGLNPIFMDPWQPSPGNPMPGRPVNPFMNSRDYPDWELVRINMGYTRRYAQRMNLNSMLPFKDLASSSYCLADPGSEYLVYLPDEGRTTVDLSHVKGELAVEWFNPRTGESKHVGVMTGGAKQVLVSPFGVDAILYLYPSG